MAEAFSVAPMALQGTKQMAKRFDVPRTHCVKPRPAVHQGLGTRLSYPDVGAAAMLG